MFRLIAIVPLLAISQHNKKLHGACIEITEAKQAEIRNNHKNTRPKLLKRRPVIYK